MWRALYQSLQPQPHWAPLVAIQPYLSVTMSFCTSVEQISSISIFISDSLHAYTLCSLRIHLTKALQLCSQGCPRTKKLVRHMAMPRPSQPRYTRIHTDEGIPLQYLHQTANDEHHESSIEHGVLQWTSGVTRGGNEESIGAALLHPGWPADMSHTQWQHHNPSRISLGSRSSLMPTRTGFVDIDLTSRSGAESYRT
jgi:hypothetical protein